ncbi:hypothetical protein EDC94DRAFT_586146 [Helicostylum pulchrum]|nr:hypothetical protein EDC94DRAFT_586146 [Helicostylum pulchrum]
MSAFHIDPIGTIVPSFRVINYYGTGTFLAAFGLFLKALPSVYARERVNFDTRCEEEYNATGVNGVEATCISSDLQNPRKCNITISHYCVLHCFLHQFSFAKKFRHVMDPIRYWALLIYTLSHNQDQIPLLQKSYMNLISILKPIILLQLLYVSAFDSVDSVKTVSPTLVF